MCFDFSNRTWYSILWAASISLLLPLSLAGQTAETSIEYAAVLESPGGALDFRLVFRQADGQKKAEIICGKESIPISVFERTYEKLVIDFPHYDSKILAKYDQTQKRFVGEWKKRLGKSKYCVMKFSARPTQPRLVVATGDTKFDQRFAGTWKVQFEKSDDPAVGIFQTDEKSGAATGTFMTTTGDYRYLGGKVDGNQLTLSCFDGAHAFLFKARMDSEGKLSGTFWSRDAWEEKWTAVKDANAALPDAFKLTKWQSNVPLTSMKFPDLDGKTRSLGDRELLGEKATLIYVFGSWCPNCHDAGVFISKLQKEYSKQGLKIIGVAFELTGDDQRDAAQVRRYLQKSKTDFPVLLVGTSDKSEASKRFTVIDRVRSYPTTLFVDGQGQIQSIHTGFSGPATGTAHQQLKKEFRKTIEEIIK